jgi:hypothetical protein
MDLWFSDFWFSCSDYLLPKNLPYLTINRSNFLYVLPYTAGKVAIQGQTSETGAVDGNLPPIVVQFCDSALESYVEPRPPILLYQRWNCISFKLFKTLRGSIEILHLQYRAFFANSIDQICFGVDLPACLGTPKGIVRPSCCLSAFNQNWTRCSKGFRASNPFSASRLRCNGIHPDHNYLRLRFWKTFYGVVGDLSEDDRRIENAWIIPNLWLRSEKENTTPKEGTELDFNASMLSACVTWGKIVLRRNK